MQRYFAQIVNDKVILKDDDCHHLLNVLRAKIGEKIEVVSDNKLFLAEISNLSPVEINPIENLEDNSELKCKVTLYYCLSKGDKNIQKVEKTFKR